MLANIVLIAIPKPFELPFFGVRKWLLYWMHKFDTQCGTIVSAKKTENYKINE
jgi:hypothetical protein